MTTDAIQFNAEETAKSQSKLRNFVREIEEVFDTYLKPHLKKFNPEAGSEKGGLDQSVAKYFKRIQDVVAQFPASTIGMTDQQKYEAAKAERLELFKSGRLGIQPDGSIDESANEEFRQIASRIYTLEGKLNLRVVHKRSSETENAETEQAGSASV